jgi:sirohydrochlorin ferrochelatase
MSSKTIQLPMSRETTYSSDKEVEKKTMTDISRLTVPEPTTHSAIEPPDSSGARRDLNRARNSRLFPGSGIVKQAEALPALAFAHAFHASIDTCPEPLQSLFKRTHPAIKRESATLRYKLGLLFFYIVVTLTGCAAVEPCTTHGTCSGQDRAAGEPEAAPGFLVAAPDRGFVGNEKVREAFSALAASNDAELVFVTDERAYGYVERARRALSARGAREIVILPLFLSRHNPRLTLFRRLLERTRGDAPVRYARPFGDTYLAVEMLAERLRNRTPTHNQAVLVAGYGAESPASRDAMETDLARIIRQATEGRVSGPIEPVVWPYDQADHYEKLEQAAWRRVETAVAEADVIRIVPFHLGKELDGMMAFDAYLEWKRPKNTEPIRRSGDESAFFSLWMQREANRYTAPTRDKVGVVFLAHGSDFHWNQTMRDAMRGLMERYSIEFAFSMADPPTIEKAVRRLEARGAGVVVIVRVFGLRSSFRGVVERLIGANVEAADRPDTEPEHRRHQAEPRLRTTAMVATAGGLEDDPLFAKALLDRARELSTEPAEETIILVAHGNGNGKRDDHWLEVLKSLAQQMRAIGGNSFRAIRYQTWREDWPEKRRPRIDSVRMMVQQAQRDGGSAIVIPARTTGSGPTRKFLADLKYRHGKGFAPHPLFAQWVEKQIETGLEKIRRSAETATPGDAAPLLDVASSKKSRSE